MLLRIMFFYVKSEGEHQVSMPCINKKVNNNPVRLQIRTIDENGKIIFMSLM